MGVDARMHVYLFPYVDVRDFRRAVATKDKNYEIVSVKETCDGGSSFEIALGRLPCASRPDLSIKPHIQLAEWLEDKYPGCEIYYGADCDIDHPLFDGETRAAMLEEEQELKNYPPTDEEQKAMDRIAEVIMLRLLDVTAYDYDPAAIASDAYDMAEEMLLQRRKRMEGY